MNLASIAEPHPPDAPALIHGEVTVTYGELRERVGRARGGVAAAGAAPGDRVAIVLPTGVDFVVAYLAALGAGTVAVPLNPQSPGAELARELATVRPSLLIATSPAAGEGRGGADGADREPSGPGAAEATALGIPVLDVAALAHDDTETTGIVDREDTDAAVLLFTSGTAGFPKAAVLTHGSLRANLEQMELRAGLVATPDDLGILLIPPSHVFGLNAVLGMHLFVGSALVLVERFDALETLAAVKAHKVTTLAAVPPVFDVWSSMDGVAGDELATVRLAYSGAAALPAEVAQRFEERFGLRLYQGYGLTEASPAVAFPDPTSPGTHPGSVGMPLPGVEVRIVDVDGEEVLAGDPGELLVRGPNVFAGYFEDPGASKAVLDRAGWLHTGDIAVMGDDAYLTLVDRRKDLVIVSGFNVYPAEVERVLAEHPSVADVAVVGVPDGSTGEAVHAFVVPTRALWPDGDETPTGLSADELIRFCAGHLARYKCPTRISFVRQLPRGIAGELLRRGLV